MRLRTCVAVVVLALGVTAVPATAAPAGVRYLGQAVVPHKLQFRGTTVGGLSGIDRDPFTGRYVLISDDRGYTEPPRFYTANVRVTTSGVDSVEITDVRTLKRPDGSTYPSPAVDTANAIDPEELRVDPWTGGYWWAQEGDRPTGKPLVQPSIRQAGRDGAHVADFTLPRNYAIEPTTGPRRNQALEALTFSSAGFLVTSVVEGPLLQDGDVPTVDRGALTRLTVQTRGGDVVAQYAYPLEKLFAVPEPGPWGPDTGVPAILADPYTPGKYLTLERQWVPGAGYDVRIFEISVFGATDVRRLDTLNANVRPVHKKLVANLKDLPLPVVDNVEGITWGSVLPTGERTLLLVSDDNFSAEEFTRFIAVALR
ncbi:esterase-like activity of phytase family protein [Saccharothrix violaceirubra]|uniref:3-phytase n=1 Tax=Saccharothrix violaceirubra TaxID=413306 RepID=A0A7W7WZX9_9PSEU|nr:esterase-like activity of phytase family protein [Saccharothrix violaceirubra]MBB4969318.1 3-phytase [Saccharothrix violaceirubra]